MKKFSQSIILGVAITVAASSSAMAADSLLDDVEVSIDIIKDDDDLYGSISFNSDPSGTDIIHVEVPFIDNDDASSDEGGTLLAAPGGKDSIIDTSGGTNPTSGGTGGSVPTSGGAAPSSASGVGFDSGDDFDNESDASGDNDSDQSNNDFEDDFEDELDDNEGDFEDHDVENESFDNQLEDDLGGGSNDTSGSGLDD